MVVKVLFSGQIFEIKILMDLQVFRSPESEKHIFRGWSSEAELNCAGCLQKEYHNFFSAYYYKAKEVATFR